MTWPPLGTVAFSIIFVLGLASSPALAERVLIKAYNGQTGQGWLFGSRGSDPGRCWIVLPRHVISEPGQRDLRPFTFQDRSGQRGESGEPVAVNEVQGAVAAPGDTFDLAFAPVAVGLKRGDCLSRLGLPPIAYDSLMRRALSLTVLSMLPTSYGIFRTEIARARSDDVGGGLFGLRAERESDAKTHFRQGVSGAVAEITTNGANYPFAMILQVKPDARIALALRFDLIRSAFSHVERSAPVPKVETNDDQTLRYRVIAFTGKPELNSEPVQTLSKPNGCWAAIGTDLEPVSLTIQVAGGAASLQGVQVISEPVCGSQPKNYRIDQRAGDRNAWAVANSCQTVSAKKEERVCFLDLRTPRQLRLTFLSSISVGLSQVLLLPDH